jgi:hypothetical protein
MKLLRESARTKASTLPARTPASLACQRQAFQGEAFRYGGDIVPARTPASLACQRQAFQGQIF